MRKFKLIGVMVISGALLLTNLVFANPSSNSTLSEIHSKVVKLASGSWVCSKCGFHIVTKSGNKPAPGSCFKSNNGPHDWVEGD